MRSLLVFTTPWFGIPQARSCQRAPQPAPTGSSSIRTGRAIAREVTSSLPTEVVFPKESIECRVIQKGTDDSDYLPNDDFPNGSQSGYYSKTIERRSPAPPSDAITRPHLMSLGLFARNSRHRSEPGSCSKTFGPGTSVVNRAPSKPMPSKKLPSTVVIVKRVLISGSFRVPHRPNC